MGAKYTRYAGRVGKAKQNYWVDTAGMQVSWSSAYLSCEVAVKVTSSCCCLKNLISSFCRIAQANCKSCHPCS